MFKLKFILYIRHCVLFAEYKSRVNKFREFNLCRLRLMITCKIWVHCKVFSNNLYRCFGTDTASPLFYTLFCNLSIRISFISSFPFLHFQWTMHPLEIYIYNGFSGYFSLPPYLSLSWARKKHNSRSRKAIKTQKTKSRSPLLERLRKYAKNGNLREWWIRIHISRLDGSETVDQRRTSFVGTLTNRNLSRSDTKNRILAVAQLFPTAF